MKHDVQLITPTDGDDINGILSDFRWLVSPGEILVLEYSFFDVDSEFYVDARFGYDRDEADYDQPFRAGFRAFDAGERDLARSIFADLENLLAIDFVEVADSLDSELRFGFTDLDRENADGLSFLPTAQFFPFEDDPGVAHETSNLSGDIWIDGAITPLDVAYTLVHEIGHALGLSHTFASGFEVLENVARPILDADLDYIGRTVMAYQQAPVGVAPDELLSFPTVSTLMPLDIAALQYLYGQAGPNTRDDVYILRQLVNEKVNPEEYGYAGFAVHDYLNSYVSIADSGGYNALIITGKRAVTIDLAQGGWYSTGGGARTANFRDDNLYISEDTLWRDITSGAGPDTITGNDLANRISTGTGTDVVSGGRGDDSIDSGAGADVVYGGAGDDSSELGDGNDIYYYTVGDDRVAGGGGIDTVYLDALEYGHFKFFLFDDEVRISQINGPTVIELDAVERMVFSDRQFTVATFQADMALANRDFILDEDVPFYLSAIGEDDVRIESIDAQLYRLYYGGLGRAPDRGGFDFWQQQIASDTFEFPEVAARFIDSPEFSGLADVDADGDISDAEFLDHMYLNVFGREPDAGGYEWWLQELDTGARSQEGAFYDMVQSDEFVLLTAATVSDFLFS